LFVKLKEKIMNNDALTVSDLIAILSKLDSSLPVRMAMNQEYECEVDASMVGVEDYGSGPVLYISDTLDANVIDDTSYYPDGSIRAKYLADDGEIRYEDTNEIATA